MAHTNTELDDDDEVMRRCRRVRDELDRRYKTVDELYEYLVGLDRQAAMRRGVRTGKAQATTKARHVVRNSKPVPRPAAVKK
jgi:hypothetical protein